MATRNNPTPASAVLSDGGLYSITKQSRARRVTLPKNALADYGLEVGDDVAVVRSDEPGELFKIIDPEVWNSE